MSLRILEDWTAEAACRDRQDLAKVFFPEPTPGARQPDYRPAKMLCASCPVREECLAEFIKEEAGVFGGYTPGERHRLRAGSREWMCPKCGLPCVVDNPAASGVHHVCRPA